MFGHFCGLYSALVPGKIMKGTCFCLALSHSQSGLVQCWSSVEFFMFSPGIPRPVRARSALGADLFFLHLGQNHLNFPIKKNHRILMRIKLTNRYKAIITKLRIYEFLINIC